MVLGMGMLTSKRYIRTLYVVRHTGTHFITNFQGRQFVYLLDVYRDGILKSVHKSKSFYYAMITTIYLIRTAF